MANKPELKEYYAAIHTDEREISGYRKRIARVLPREKSAFARFFPIWLGLAAAGVLLLFLFLPSREVVFPQKTMTEIETLLAKGNKETLGREALFRVHTATGTERLNAIIILCMTQPEGAEIRLAAEGALADPRPEFRSYFLEYLLDYADEYQLNTALIEERMEIETDKECLYLYGELLKLAPFS